MSIGVNNSSLGENILSYNESEDAYYIQHGADSVPKKLGSSISNAVLTVLNSTTLSSASTTISIPSDCSHTVFNVTIGQGVGGRYINNFSFSGDISNIKTIAEIDKYTANKDQLLVYEFDTIPNGTINISITIDATNAYVPCEMSLLY